MNRTITLTLVFTLGFLMSPFSCVAACIQQNSTQQQTKKPEVAKDELKQAFNQIKILVREDKRKNAGLLMTRQGLAEYQSSPITQGINLVASERDMYPPIAQFDEMRKRDTEKKKQYKILIKQFGLEDLKDTDREFVNKDPEIVKNIMSILEKKGVDPWDVFEAFGRVAGSENRNVFDAEPVKSEIEGSNGIIEIQPDYSGMMGGNPGGEPAQVSGPPLVVAFKKSNDGWKYHGIDEERTIQAGQKFMEQFAPSGEGNGKLDNMKFSGETVDGKEIKLEDYRGKVVLVEFWGTWCIPCIKAQPELKRIHKALKPHGFEIIGIAGDNRKQLTSFLEEHELPWPNIIDGLSALSRKFGISAYPTTVLLDQEGKRIGNNIHGDELIEKIGEQLQLTEEQVESVKQAVAEAKNTAEVAEKADSKKPAAKDTGKDLKSKEPKDK